MGLVTVRYWAAARAAAGVSEERYPVGDVAALRVAVADRHGERMRAVLAAASLVGDDGVRLDASAPLADGAVVEVLPPFAGG
jgi:molybdopterin converting factor small subunit